MRLENFYLPLLKSNPSSASIASHKLLLRAGVMRQTAQGIYTLLPLGHKVVGRIQNIIATECDANGCLQITMPTIQPASLWEKSGRYDSYGKEMLCIKDRHNKDLLYGPTHEEVITDLLTKDLLSYKNLPLNLYQMHWKFRDEIRPRFGLMRCREFLMFDAYSVDMTDSSAIATYHMYYRIFLNIFKKMNLLAIPMVADAGEIGGSLSHEFQIIADTGESEIVYDIELEKNLKDGVNYTNNDIVNMYAVTKEKHDTQKCNVPAEKLALKRGIEIGHIFLFGQKYSSVMGLSIKNASGEDIHPFMGSYGIGITRLLSALVEVSHDDHGIIWDESIAPFDVIILNLDTDHEEACKAAEEVYQMAKENKIDALYDNTNTSVGEKRATADLIGIPYQICFGKKHLENNNCEIKQRKTKQKVVIGIDKLKNNIANKKGIANIFTS